MVIKTALNGILTLISRSGLRLGVDIAQQVGLTLIGRMRAEIHLPQGQHRLVFDQGLCRRFPDEDKNGATGEVALAELTRSEHYNGTEHDWCAVNLAGGQANRMAVCKAI